MCLLMQQGLEMNGMRGSQTKQLRLKVLCCRIIANSCATTAEDVLEWSSVVSGRDGAFCCYSNIDRALKIQ